MNIKFMATGLPTSGPLSALARTFVTIAPVVGALVSSPEVSAQGAARMPRVGVLYMGAPSSADAAADGFGKGMRDLGYVASRRTSRAPFVSLARAALKPRFRSRPPSSPTIGGCLSNSRRASICR